MDLPVATQRFVRAAREAGLDPTVHLFPEGTKTAADAAAAIGCDLAAIVKSLVFMAGEKPVLVLMPGDLRLATDKLGALVGTTVRRASLEEVRSHTGYAAGGTPPVGHRAPLWIFVDRQMRRCDEVWAAAGTPTTVFPVDVQELVAVSGAEWADLAETAPGGV